MSVFGGRLERKNKLLFVWQDANKGGSILNDVPTFIVFCDAGIEKCSSGGQLPNELRLWPSSWDCLPLVTLARFGADGVLPFLSLVCHGLISVPSIKYNFAHRLWLPITDLLPFFRA